MTSVEFDKKSEKTLATVEAKNAQKTAMPRDYVFDRIKARKNRLLSVDCVRTLQRTEENGTAVVQNGRRLGQSTFVAHRAGMSYF